MIIKKFTGKNEEEALAQAKKELGDGLVVMSVKKIRKRGILGLLSRKNIELTAAVEDANEIKRNREEAQKKSEADIRDALNAIKKVVNEDEKGKENAQPSSVKPVKKENPIIADKGETKADTENIEKKLEQLQSLLESKLTDDADSSEQKEKKEDKENKKEESELDRFIEILRGTLIDSEMDDKYVDQAVGELKKNLKPGTDVDHALEEIYQKLILRLGGPALLRTSDKGPRALFFVGPTGVGKTTTIAKIASRMMIDQKKKVALLTADTYRIAAVEQLRTYADILGTPFHVVYTADEVREKAEALRDYDFILVDTAGHSVNNDEQRAAMNAIMHSLDDVLETQVYLVLSVTAKYKDLVKTADVYSKLAKYDLIFTKLDETDSIGCIYNLHMHTGADVAFVTDGQKVPDDIDVFDPQKTVKILLGGKD